MRGFDGLEDGTQPGAIHPEFQFQFVHFLKSFSLDERLGARQGPEATLHRVQSRAAVIKPDQSSS